MPHNHPPRCCCGQATPHARVRVCPSCPEHGELALLSQPHAIAYNPADEDEECGKECNNLYPHDPHGNCPGDHDPE